MTTFARFDTTEVFNQSPLYENVDLLSSDLPLQEAVKANGAAADMAALAAFGRQWGTAEMFAQARRANENPPKLQIFDAKGFRRDVVEFHPAYHDLMRASVTAGLHASTWTSAGARAAPPAEVKRAARYYMVSQIECGHLCPITMTRAALGALSANPTVLAHVAPKVTTASYDPAFRPWFEKSGMTLGMGMTEKQGGTDVRANSTTATPAGEFYSITGHKWFMSAPMCDAFMVLAQAPGGLTCFFVPRFKPDGTVNGLRFQRLKDKLGNRSNASSEVEFADAYGLRIGDEGAGVRTIIQMVQLTRLDCGLASAGYMRMALAQAVHHCRHRSVFQKHLYDQPMMRTVLADLALEVEGAVALIMRLARAFDYAATDPREAAYARAITPAAKYWICKTAPNFIYEAMECLGGNGYVEESVLPRLYREAPLNAIWEGSGNVMCLDVLRALRRDPEAADFFAGLVDEASPLIGERAAVIDMAGEVIDEGSARIMVSRLATLAATAALARTAPPDVADAFAQTRFFRAHAALYGAAGIETHIADILLRRALPEK
ncbi:MAG: acyl-CoA dehydrogenase family protein [Hyphomicrobiales bacterium]|nr:acyl-CoA dehydrogenase family protein [Hyphomicrobiales bacterium]